MLTWHLFSTGRDRQMNSKFYIHGKEYGILPHVLPYAARVKQYGKNMSTPKIGSHLGCNKSTTTQWLKATTMTTSSRCADIPYRSGCSRLWHCACTRSLWLEILVSGNHISLWPFIYMFWPHSMSCIVTVCILLLMLQVGSEKPNMIVIHSSFTIHTQWVQSHVKCNYQSEFCNMIC